MSKKFCAASGTSLGRIFPLHWDNALGGGGPAATCMHCRTLLSPYGNRRSGESAPSPSATTQYSAPGSTPRGSVNRHPSRLNTAPGANPAAISYRPGYSSSLQSSARGHPARFELLHGGVAVSARCRGRAIKVWRAANGPEPSLPPWAHCSRFLIRHPPARYRQFARSLALRRALIIGFYLFRSSRPDAKAVA